MKLSYDDQRNILLVYCDGVLTDPALDELCAAVETFANTHTNCRGLLDLSDVIGASATTWHIKDKAQNKPILHGQTRVIVAPNKLLYALARMFQITQTIANTGETTHVVHSMQEAYAILDIDVARFAPVS